MAPLDRRQRDALVLDHVGLARRLARKYAQGNRELIEELEQVAALGLVQAANRFEPARGTAFSTFAVPTIAGELRKYFRTNRWSAHVPRRLQEAHLRARAAEGALTAERGHAPGAAELARHLGWKVEDLLEARAAAGALAPVSLAQPVGEQPDAPALVECLGSEDPGYRASELRDAIEQARASLEPLEDEAVRLRYEAGLSFGEIARRLGVSRSRASSLVGRALHELRTSMQLEAA